MGEPQKTFHQIKEARHKILHIVWLHWNEMYRKDKSIGTESTLGVAWSWSWERGLTINKHEGSLLE